MKTAAWCLLLVIVSHLTYGQKQDVIEEVDDSQDYAEKALRYSDDAIAEIKKGYSATTLDDMLNYARRAKSATDDAMSYAAKAEDEADDAERKASTIGCSEAEDEADDAEEYFQRAKSELDDAYTALRSAASEDSKDDVNTYLKKAERAIDDGIGYLKKGLDELDDTLDEVKECD